MSAQVEQRNQDATVYVGNLDEKVSEELLWELMLQIGPVVNVFLPKDKVSGKMTGYGFVEYRTEEDAEYAMKVMNMVKLYGRPIKVNKSSQDKKALDVGANIFIGNLDPAVDEKLLHDTFSAFGGILVTPKIMTDTDSGTSKGYGFVAYDNFESADLAIECMNQQYLCNRQIVVQYAFKKDTPGERHGSQAERILAASQPQRLKPNTMFSSGQGDNTNLTQGAMATPGMLQNTPEFQYLQYSNPMMYQQMAMYGGGFMPPAMPMMPPVPPPIPQAPLGFAMPIPPPPPPAIPQAPPAPPMGLGMIPPPPPPLPQ
jgi:splicing factor 3B subunit 4